MTWPPHLRLSGFSLSGLSTSHVVDCELTGNSATFPDYGTTTFLGSKPDNLEASIEVTQGLVKLLLAVGKRILDSSGPSRGLESIENSLDVRRLAHNA